MSIYLRCLQERHRLRNSPQPSHPKRVAPCKMSIFLEVGLGIFRLVFSVWWPEELLFFLFSGTGELVFLFMVLFYPGRAIAWRLGISMLVLHGVRSVLVLSWSSYGLAVGCGRGVGTVCIWFWFYDVRCSLFWLAFPFGR